MYNSPFVLYILDLYIPSFKVLALNHIPESPELEKFGPYVGPHSIPILESPLEYFFFLLIEKKKSFQ